MLKEDGTVPTHPCWTAHGFFSLNTRPGLAIHRRDYERGVVGRLRPLKSFQALTPLPNVGSTPQNDKLLIPSNEIRRRVLDGPSSYQAELLTPGQSFEAYQLKKRRRGLSGWPDDQLVLDKDRATGSTSEQHTALTDFENMLPALQRKAWVSFPSSVSRPIPFSTVRDVISEEDLGIEAHPLSPTARPDKRHSQNKAETYRRGNLLTRFNTWDENVCVVAPSGRLDSVTAFSISTDDSAPSPALHIRRYASCQRIPSIIMSEEEPVFDMISLTYADDNENVRFLAATSNSISLATISSDGILKWQDHLEVPNVKSSALNPLHPEEFSVLSSEGLFCGTADAFRAWRASSDVHHNCLHDVQCLLPEAQYRQVEYGTHPRTVLLASRKELVQFDLRARRREDRLAIFDLRSNPETQARDAEIGTFCFAPNSDGFRLLLATRASLAYFDIRRPEVPLLDWSLVLPSSPDKICAASLNPECMRSDIVLLASSQWGQTDVYHAVHTGKHEALSPFYTDVEPESYRLPKLELAWSDLPLPTPNLSAFQDSIGGITVMSDSGDHRATVLQWSGRTGLTVHPLEITFLSDREDGKVESCRSKAAENSVNLNNSISSFDFSRGRCSCDRFPVSRSIPGSYLHSRLKRLLLRDVKELRKRLCCGEDDDRASDGSSRIPRPYMQDLVSSETCGDTASVASTPEEPPKAQPSPRHEATHRDDTADRDTVIGEAALLRSEESDDSDDPESGSLDFINAIGSGCLFDELSRSVRSGFGHHPMPLGMATLKEAISESPLTNSFETTWHDKCETVHSASSTAVTTADTLPSWLCTKVYFTEEAEKGDSLLNSSIPESSQYGVLLARMQTEFFK